MAKSSRLIAFLLLAAGISFLLLFSLGSAFRDNDQVALVAGALRVVRGHTSLFHPIFYNYDKQWGTYLLLTVFSLGRPGLDPVLRGNILQVALLLPALLLSLLAIYRRGRVPLWTVVPIFVSPALLLYAPFLATGSMSLAFLFGSFFLARMHWRVTRQWALPVAVAAAAACRGDVVLVAPMIILSGIPRCSLPRLVLSRFAWTVSLAAVLPVLFGKWLDARHEDDFAALSFHLPLITGFVVFALGIGVALLLGLALLARVPSLSRRKWRLFYAAEMGALLLPVVFYGLQLYSPRYFFLTLIALLFSAASRRGVVQLRRIPRPLPAIVLALALLPWVVGLSLPSLHDARPTLLHPSEFPTADGVFPMGAYGAFALELAGPEHFLADHNQKTWETAETVVYRTCNGRVPFIATPMSTYLYLVMQYQHRETLRLTNLAGSPCGGAYVDLRAVIRNDSLGVDEPQANLTVVSGRAELGRPIVWMSKNEKPSGEAETFRELARYFHGRDAEVLIHPPGQVKPDAPGRSVVYFSFGGSCERRPGTVHLCVGTDGSDGWARSVFPGYIGK